MKKQRIILALAVAGLIAGSAAWAQAPGPGGAPAQGFSVPVLISQLSLYLPPEATQGLGGFGRVGGGQGGAQGTGAQAGGGQAGGQASGAQATRTQGGQDFRQLFQFTRDPKLYLTKDQIAKLLPILQGLRENPILSPSKAKQVQASVDALLSVAQKAEYADYQKQMQKAIEEMRKQFAASGQGTGTGQAAGGGGGQEAAGGQGAAGQQRQGGGTQMTATQRAQRELDAFIKVLQDRQKQVST
jgi:hypothetical protein